MCCCLSLFLAWGNVSKKTAGNVICRCATQDDVAKLLAFQSKFKEEFEKTVVVFPEPYQRQFLQKSIAKWRIFIAVDTQNDAVVAQIKVCIIDDPQELTDMLYDELRCVGEQRKLIESGIFDSAFNFAPSEREQFELNKKTLYLTTGAAFTHPAYRGNKINIQLKRYAFSQLKDVMRQKICTQGYTALAWVYGLVDENKQRTDVVLRQFFPLGQSISRLLGQTPTTTISFFAYKTYKPVFGITADGVLIKLPNEPSRHGRGCILLYALR
jgi:hypothetical protein